VRPRVARKELSSLFQWESRHMKGLRSIIVISTIVAAAAALSACDRAYKDASMKRGAGEVSMRAGAH